MDGTAGALWKARPALKEKFLAMNGDDLYSLKDTEECLKYEWAMQIQERKPLGGGGKVLLDAHHCVTDIIENPDHGNEAGYVGTGMYMLDQRIFENAPVPKSEGSDEYGLPQTLLSASKHMHVPIHAVPTTFWLQITTPEDLQKAEEILENKANDPS
jgi:NDP-sugar pyrophosphorylase family protein